MPESPRYFGRLRLQEGRHEGKQRRIDFEPDSEFAPSAGAPRPFSLQLRALVSPRGRRVSRSRWGFLLGDGHLLPPHGFLPSVLPLVPLSPKQPHAQIRQLIAGPRDFRSSPVSPSPLPASIKPAHSQPPHVAIPLPQNRNSEMASASLSPGPIYRPARRRLSGEQSDIHALLHSIPAG
jgi:hypothetical protein